VNFFGVAKKKRKDMASPHVNFGLESGFLAEESLVTIIPQLQLEELHFISGS
jgi:hypothetical protein